MNLKPRTTTHWFTCLVMASAVFSDSAFSQEIGKSARTAADREAITAQIDAWTAAVNNRDADAIADLYTKDGNMIIHDGQKVSGQENIRKTVAKEFAALPPAQRIKIIVTNIRFFNPDLAIIDTEATHSEGESRKDRGTHVMIRDSEKWRTASLRVYSAQRPPKTVWPRELLPLVASPKQHKVIFENDSVRVFEVTNPPGGIAPLHVHTVPSVIIVEEPAKIRLRDADGGIIREYTPLAGASWVPSSKEPYSVENIDSKRIRLYRVEMKNK